MATAGRTESPERLEARHRNERARGIAEARTEDARAAVLALPFEERFLVFHALMRGNLQTNDPEIVTWALLETAPERLIALAATTPAGGGLAVLTVAVETMPAPANLRSDPILPRFTVKPVTPERERGGRLFGGLVPLDKRRLETLPLFPEATEPHTLTRVPLLELADAQGVVSMAKGRGAPLDLRLTVEAVLSVSYELRARESVRIAWTVQELMEGLFPRGFKLHRADRPGDWERVWRALVAADARWIPWQHGGRWWLLRVRGEPGDRPLLTDKVVVEVALPPGSAAGPVLDRAALRVAGVESAPAYRTLIGVHTIAWWPGRTRLPRPGVGGLWTGDASRYPVLTAADRRRIAFGADSAHSMPRVDQAIRDTSGVVVIDTEAVDESGRRGWRVVPAAAARAIMHRGANRSESGANRSESGANRSEQRDSDQ